MLVTKHALTVVPEAKEAKYLVVELEELFTLPSSALREQTGSQGRWADEKEVPAKAQLVQEQRKSKMGVRGVVGNLAGFQFGGVEIARHARRARLPHAVQERRAERSV